MIACRSDITGSWSFDLHSEHDQCAEAVVGENIEIDLSNPEDVERGTELMRYLVGANLTQPYPDDPLTLHDHLQNVVAPAYAELGGRATDIEDKISLMAHTIQAAVKEIMELLLSAALDQVVDADPEMAARVVSENDEERQEAIGQLLDLRRKLWQDRQLNLSDEGGD